MATRKNSDGIRLHIVEPTLRSETGHCYSFLRSLFQAIEDERVSLPVTVWVSNDAVLPKFDKIGVEIVPVFRRRLRKIQAFFLYRKLLMEPGRIFIQTAGRTDLFLLHEASRGEIQSGKVFLYFHWLRMNQGKAAFFRRMAARQPELSILSPVNTLVEKFIALDFPHVTKVPYPLTPHRTGARNTGFRHLLYAGAARQEKGMAHVVNLLEYMARNEIIIPVTIQTSPDHYDRYDDKTRADLSRLKQIGYPQLSTCPETLGAEEYDDLFRGGICLQPYRRDKFVDRVSGVTMDALSMGCPIVTTQGTWMARMVERFGAGIALARISPENLWGAVNEIRSDYPAFRDRAFLAGDTLGTENSARHLLSLFMAEA